MPLISGKGFRTRKQAIDFLLRDLHLSLKPEIVEWFDYVKNHFPESELEEEGRERVGKQLKKIYSHNVDWRGILEYIAAPYWSFNISYFDFIIDLHVVASVEVIGFESRSTYHYIGPEGYFGRELLKKGIEKFKLPLAFMEGVSKEDLSQFERRGDDSSGYFTWYVPSLNQEIRLHASFLKCLKEAFLGKPLGPSLVLHGLVSLGEGLLAEQSLLLSASSPDLKTSSPDLKTSWSEEEVRSAFEKLGATREERNKAIFYLKGISPQPSSNKEAINAAIRFIGSQKPL